jgi:hypothetical protein
MLAQAHKNAELHKGIPLNKQAELIEIVGDPI